LSLISIEVLVGGYQRHRPEAGVLMAPVEIEDGGQLYGIVGPEPMLARRRHRVIEQGWGQFDDVIALGEVPAEMPEHRSGLGARKVAAALPAGDRGRDLDSGDARDLERVGRLGSDEGFHPGAAGLDHMALD
jgi:hypothetical protein